MGYRLDKVMLAGLHAGTTLLGGCATTVAEPAPVLAPTPIAEVAPPAPVRPELEQLSPVDSVRASTAWIAAQDHNLHAIIALDPTALAQAERAGQVACNVLFSPSWGQVEPRDLAEWILADRLDVRLQVQLHKYLWGNEPGR